MKSSKILFLIVAVLIMVTISTALVYYVKLMKHEVSDIDVEIQVIIDYGTLKTVGNPENHIINVTEGRTALTAFSMVAELNTVNHSFGVYIKGVNGYDEILPNYWAFYTYNLELNDWIYSAIGVNHHFLKEGDRIKLEYTG